MVELNVQNLSASAARVQRALNTCGFSNSVIELTATTRSAQEAADAIGCQVAQIAKSLIFKGQKSEKAILVIASGVNRVDEKKVSAIIGESIEKADADFAREQTGYAIGGIPPLGHDQPVRTLIDQDLMTYPEIWAAAGTPNAVFKLTGAELLAMTNGEVNSIKKWQAINLTKKFL